MKGLYKGKYLIVYYDKDEFPIIVASSSVEFEELYRKFINPNIQKRSMVQILSRISMGVITRSNIKLVEADTVVDDCFKEADIDFINFVKQTRKKTNKEISTDLGISEGYLYHRKKESRQRRQHG